MMDFTIITKKSVFSDDRDFESETYIEELSIEQDEKIRILGFDMFSNMLIHFFDSAFCDDSIEEMDIYTAIESLAIKDGCDLVQFGNGNYGFVAYYNGRKNGFEIIA